MRRVGIRSSRILSSPTPPPSPSPLPRHPAGPSRVGTAGHDLIPSHHHPSFMQAPGTKGYLHSHFSDSHRSIYCALGRRRQRLYGGRRNRAHESSGPAACTQPRREPGLNPRDASPSAQEAPVGGHLGSCGPGRVAWAAGLGSGFQHDTPVDGGAGQVPAVQQAADRQPRRDCHSCHENRAQAG